MTREELESKRHSDIMELMGKTHDGVEGVKKDVGTLSTAFKLHEQSDDHVHSDLGKRVSSLEESAEATGEHKIVRLEEKLEKASADKEKWRGRIWAIAATFIVAAITGLVTHWVSTG